MLVGMVCKAAMAENFKVRIEGLMSMMENKIVFSEKISRGQLCRRIREWLGLTQSEFGAIVGVSKNADSDWENGKYEPSDAHWKIIKALPDLKMNANEELQLSFLKILPLCPACRKVVEDYINNLYKLLRKKMIQSA